jgi:hypothetical protein
MSREAHASIFYLSEFFTVIQSEFKQWVELKQKKYLACVLLHFRLNEFFTGEKGNVSDSDDFFGPGCRLFLRA